MHLYTVHYLGYEKVRKKTREYYLGPEESYEYVSKTHFREGLVFRGMIDFERALAYLDAIINYN